MHARQHGLIISTSSRTLTGSPFCMMGSQNDTTTHEAKPLTNSSDVGLETVGYRRVPLWETRDPSFDLSIKPI